MKDVKVNHVFVDIVNWIKNDWSSNNFRFIAELTAWALSIGCSLVMALTVPTPPLHLLYPAWIIGCAIYAWAAYTRKSFGMLLNYLLLVSIDTVGLIRLYL